MTSEKKVDKVPAKGKVLVYRNRVEVLLDKDTVWLTQKQIADLFDTERSVITKHVRNIYNNKELDRKSVCAKFAHTAEDDIEEWNILEASRRIGLFI